MKKIISIAILISLLSCTPFQRLLIVPANLNNFLEDTCDILIVKQLKHSLDTIKSNTPLDQAWLLEDLITDSECEYYGFRHNPPLQDSAIWYMTIRPVLVGKKEITVGSLFTFDPDQDSTFIFQRRVKEYSQMKDFETGKYVVFTYFLENDSTIIKAGKRKKVEDDK